MKGIAGKLTSPAMELCDSDDEGYPIVHGQDSREELESLEAYSIKVEPVKQKSIFIRQQMVDKAKEMLKDLEKISADAEKAAS